MVYTFVDGNEFHTLIPFLHLLRIVREKSLSFISSRTRRFPFHPETFTGEILVPLFLVSIDCWKIVSGSRRYFVFVFHNSSIKRGFWYLVKHHCWIGLIQLKVQRIWRTGINYNFVKSQAWLCQSETEEFRRITSSTNKTKTTKVYTKQMIKKKVHK